MLIVIIVLWILTLSFQILNSLLNIQRTEKKKRKAKGLPPRYYSTGLEVFFWDIHSIRNVRFYSNLLLICSFLITFYFDNLMHSIFFFIGTLLLSYLIARLLIHFDGNWKGGFRQTNFLYNAQIGNYDMVEDQIKRGIDISCSDINGYTALDLAANHGHIEIVKLLITNKANIDIKDYGKATPLFSAITGLHLDIVNYLIHAGASLDTKDMNQNTPLMAAIYANKSNEIIQYLIECGSDVNYQNPINGQTPLMITATFDNVEVFNILLKKGAKLNSTDINGFRAYDYAKLENSQKVLSVIANVQKIA